MNNEIVRCPRQRVTASGTGDINMIVSEGIRRIMTASLTKCRVENNDSGRPSFKDKSQNLWLYQVKPTGWLRSVFVGHIFVVYIKWCLLESSSAAEVAPKAPQCLYPEEEVVCGSGIHGRCWKCSLALWILLLITGIMDLIASYHASEGIKARIPMIIPTS